MVNRVDEYEQMVVKDITLPSGKVWTIGPPDSVTIALYFEKMGLSMDDEKLQERLKGKTVSERISAAVLTIVPNSVLDPPLSVDREDGKLWVRLITPADLIFVTNCILDVIGIGEEDIDDISFPE